MLYDIIILGGGPAGTAAAVYSARKKLKTLLITESFGGQSIVSDDIENWIGDKHISGLDLAKRFEEHVKNYPDDIDLKMPEKVIMVKKISCESGERPCDFEVETDKGNKYEGKVVILTMGAHRRRLGVPGEDEFEGKGVSYCSTCDAPLFKGMKVAVVGGGNAGLEAAVDLLPYATEIYILQRSGALKGDPVVQERIEQEERIQVLLNASTIKILGERMVTGLVYKDNDGNEKTLEVGGVFVEIGSVPNTDSVKDLVELDKYSQVKIDSKHSSTSEVGIFSAGDITDDPYKQNNISVGDAVKAALAAYAYLQNLGKKSPAEEN